MNPSEYQEDWLSAYLDDELTEEQQQVVETRLATDAAARSMLEDLKRVRKLVSELAPWSGEDLRANMDSIIHRPVDHEPEDLGADELGTDDLGTDTLHRDSSADGSTVSSLRHTYEEVPQSLSGDGRETLAAANWSNKRTRRFPIVWLASAASIVLALGLGAAVWYGSGSVLPSLALRNSVETSSSAKTSSSADLAPAGAAIESQQGVESDAFHQAADADTLQSVPPFEPAPDAQAAPEAQAAPLNAPASDRQVAGGAPSPLSRSMPAEPSAPQAARSDNSLAMDLPASPSELGLERGYVGPADVAMAPATPSLPKPSLPKSKLSAPGGIAPADPVEAMARANEPAAPAARSVEDAAGSLPEASPVADTLARASQSEQGVRIASSVTWSDEEIQAALNGPLSSLGLNIELPQSADNLPLATQEETPNESSAVTVMLASLDPAAVVSSDIFAELVGENQLTQRELARGLEEQMNAPGRGLATEQATKEQSAQGELAGVEPQAKLSEAGTGEARTGESGTGEPGVGKRGRAVNELAARSLVLFLTQADAERILEKLKQNGRVKPQVWQVTQNMESAAAAAIEPKLDQSATAKTSAPADKVILLLTAPPR